MLRFHDGYPETSPYLQGDVRILQASLITHGFPMTSDGKFGSSTLTAVKAFQRRHGLVDDGVVGPKTWTLLAAKPAMAMGTVAPPAPKVVAPAEVGDTPDYTQISANFEARIPGSKYFTWHEALFLPSWRRHSNASEVNAKIIANVIRQARALDRVRDHFNASLVVHCWLRPPGYNAHIGGAKNSAHLRGAATDFHISGYSAAQVRQALIKDATIYPGAGELRVTWNHLDLEHKYWFNP